MRVKQIDNSTNFGINIINKEKWSKRVLETVENSKVVKSIDEKYPKASVNYSKIELTDLDPVNSEPNFLVSLIFDLEKGKVSTVNMNSHSSDGADSAVRRYMDVVTLEELEKKAKTEREFPSFTTEITPKKEENRVGRFLSGLFHNN